MKLLEDNKRFLDFLGVSKFHNAGYYGSRVTVGNGEEWKLSEYDGDGLVTNPLWRESSVSSEHGIKTCKVFHQIAPKSKVVQFPYWGDLLYKSIEYFKDSVTILSVSMGKSTKVHNLEEIDDALSKTELFYVMSAGNESTKSYNRFLDSKYIYGVGAYNLLYPSNEIMPTYYSSSSEEVDFIAPTLINIEDSETIVKFPGTSCSCPVIAGMCALVNDFFIDKTGKPLTRDKMYQFVVDHCVDVAAEGKDVKTGYGAFILPNPDEIDISKYESGSMLDQFGDKDQISPWAVEYVKKAVSLGLMNGTGSNFNPKGNITREEAATLAVRLYEKIRGEM